MKRHGINGKTAEEKIAVVLLMSDQAGLNPSLVSRKSITPPYAFGDE
jgi:hypothetical protein